MSAVAEPSLVEVASGVYAWVQPDGTWWLNNTGAVHDRDEVLLVDTCATRTRTQAMLDAVAAATHQAAVRWAVNTHHHGDHVYGNALLPASASIVGHAHMRQGMTEDFIFDACPPFWTPTPQWGVDELRLPDVTFESSIVVRVGDLSVAAHHPGYAAHTSGDAIAHVPDCQVLFAGDLLFNGLTPMLLMGSVDGARRSLEWIASFEPTVVVPGHGPVIGAEDLDRVLGEHDRYYQLVEATTNDGIARDLSPLEAARSAELGEFAHWLDDERLVLNVHKAYADAAGTPVDLIAAMSDAMTWNGGPFHTHLDGGQPCAS